MHDGAQALDSFRRSAARGRAARHRHAGAERLRGRAPDPPGSRTAARVTLIAVTGWGQDTDKARARRSRASTTTSRSRSSPSGLRAAALREARNITSGARVRARVRGMPRRNRRVACKTGARSSARGVDDRLRPAGRARPWMFSEAPNAVAHRTSHVQDDRSCRRSPRSV